MQDSTKTPISIPQVLQDLQDGYTRLKTGNGRSIEEKYNLTPKEVKILFKHPQLVGKKTKKKEELSFYIVEEEQDQQEGQVEEATAENQDAPVTTELFTN
jgi:hypothetical protein